MYLNCVVYLLSKSCFYFSEHKFFSSVLNIFFLRMMINAPSYPIRPIQERHEKKKSCSFKIYNHFTSWFPQFFHTSIRHTYIIHHMCRFFLRHETALKYSIFFFAMLFLDIHVSSFFLLCFSRKKRIIIISRIAITCASVCVLLCVLSGATFSHDIYAHITSTAASSNNRDFC